MEIFEDNASAIRTVTREEVTGAGRHLETAYYYVQEQVALRKNVKITYLETAKMLADINNKALGTIKFERFRHDMGMRDSATDAEVRRIMDNAVAADDVINWDTVS